MDKILQCDIWNETSSQYFHMVLCVFSQFTNWSYEVLTLVTSGDIVKEFVLHGGENPLTEEWKNKNCFKMSLAKSMQWNVD